LQGWLPAGQPKVIAIGDGAEAFVCSTLEEFQVARVGESGVRWTRSAPGGSSCGEFGGKVLTVAERVVGVDELVYLDAADGRERWRVTPGGSAWRTFQVGTWRVDYDDSRRVWFGPREWVEGVRRAVRGLGTPVDQVEVIDVGGGFGAVIERRVSTAWVVASEGGVVLREQGPPQSGRGEAETGRASIAFVSERFEVMRLGEVVLGPPVLVAGRIVRGARSADGMAALEISNRLGDVGAAGLSWSRVALSKRGRPFVRAAVGHHGLAWVFVELEEEHGVGGGAVKSMHAALVELMDGRLVAVADGGGEASSIVAMLGSRGWGDGEVQGAVIVDQGPNEVVCLRWDGSVGRLEVSEFGAGQSGGVRPKVHFARQVGGFAMIQRDAEVIFVDSARCGVLGRVAGWSGLSNVGREFVWITGPGRLARYRWGAMSPEVVIENR